MSPPMGQDNVNELFAANFTITKLAEESVGHKPMYARASPLPFLVSSAQRVHLCLNQKTRNMRLWI